MLYSKQHQQTNEKKNNLKQFHFKHTELSFSWWTLCFIKNQNVIPVIIDSITK